MKYDKKRIIEYVLIYYLSGEAVLDVSVVLPFDVLRGEFLLVVKLPLVNEDLADRGFVTSVLFCKEASSTFWRI
jgi:hypothetical protein